MIDVSLEGVNDNSRTRTVAYPVPWANLTVWYCFFYLFYIDLQCEIHQYLDTAGWMTGTALDQQNLFSDTVLFDKWNSLYFTMGRPFPNTALSLLHSEAHGLGRWSLERLLFCVEWNVKP